MAERRHEDSNPTFSFAEPSVHAPFWAEARVGRGWVEVVVVVVGEVAVDVGSVSIPFTRAFENCYGNWHEVIENVGCQPAA